MCEKPVAHTVAVGKELLDEYNRDHKPKGVLWAVLENYRFEPGLLRAGELAATAIGKLAIAEIRFHTPIPAGSRFASHDRTSLMIEAGCHFTAGMRVLLPTAGRVVASAGFSYGCGSHLPSPDTLTAVYNFEGGVGATMAVALGTSIRKCEALLSGTAGCVEVRRCVQDGKHGYSVTTTGKDDEFHPFAGVGAAIQCFGQAVSMTLAGGKPLFDSRLTAEEALLDIQLIEDVVSTPLPMPDAPALPV